MDSKIVNRTNNRSFINFGCWYATQKPMRHTNNGVSFFMTRKLIWYKTCPFCNQGRLFVFKNLNANKLYLHCEECERGYYDPNQINVENSFLTLQQDFEDVAATYNDLKEHKWDILEINIVYE